MKKIKRNAALVGAVLIAAAMTGCDLLAKPASGSTIGTADENSAQTSKEPVIVQRSALFGSLKECIEDPEIKAELDAMKKEADDGSYKLEIYAENETDLVFEFSYIAEDISEDQRPAMKQNIESRLATGSYAVYYTSLAADLQHDVGDKSITVIVRYLDKTGYVLGEHQYIPQTSTPEISVS